jgi:hypothetical protein
MAPVLGQQRQADLVADSRRAAAVGGLPARDAGHGAVQHDRQRRGLGTDEAVLLPAAACAGVAEAEPLEGAECRWIGAEPVEEAEVIFAERPQREVVVHDQVVTREQPGRPRPALVSVPIADPADFFIQSVDTERWLVGRVALVFEGQRPEQHDERTVLVPNADGAAVSR